MQSQRMVESRPDAVDARTPGSHRPSKAPKRERRIALVTTIERTQASIACALQCAEFLVNDYHASEEIHRAVTVLRDLPLWRELVGELYDLDADLEEIWQQARDLA